jgi:predicted O-methyltransferase YrrM
VLRRLQVHSAAWWLGHRLGLLPPRTQTTAAERAALSRLAQGRRTVVEIGVFDGANTALLRSVMAADGEVFGIDPHPPGRLGVSFERLIAARELSRIPNGRAHLVRQLSTEAVHGWARPIDFLFIDGDHSWTGISRDWDDWIPHLAPGAVVALHDSRPMPGEISPDSVRFTNEVVLPDRRFQVLATVDRLTALELSR